MKKLLKLFILIAIMCFYVFLNTNNVFADSDWLRDHPDAFYFEAAEDDTFIEFFRTTDLVDINVNLYYSIDDGLNWNEYTLEDRIYLNTGEKIYFKAGPEGNVTFAEYREGQTTYHRFHTNKDVYCHGNIQYLLDPDGKQDSVTEKCFYGLFSGGKLLSAPTLPATTLAQECYALMFYLSNLVTAPDLPATTLAEYCYNSMFRDCKSLKIAPDLPATKVLHGSYTYMFYGCTSLETAPDLPATTIDDASYFHMFFGCTSLVNIPEKLPALTVRNNSYNSMFMGCTSLEKAPELPATVMGLFSYERMFAFCTSLEKAPELPTTELRTGCYAAMFAFCTSLTEGPSVLPAKELGSNSYTKMFYGCTSLKKPPKICASNAGSKNAGGMFYGCSSLEYYPNIYSHKTTSSYYTFNDPSDESYKIPEDRTSTEFLDFIDNDTRFVQAKIYPFFKNTTEAKSDRIPGEYEFKYYFPATYREKDDKVPYDHFASEYFNGFGLNDNASSEQANGKGVVYTKSAIVSYNDNDATEGDVPTEDVIYSMEHYLDIITVLPNTGELYKDDPTKNYNEIFDGWCTEPTGYKKNKSDPLVHTYDPNDPGRNSFSLDGYVTLFVNWLHFEISPNEDVHYYVKGSNKELYLECEGSEDTFTEFNLAKVEIDNVDVTDQINVKYRVRNTGRVDEGIYLLPSYLETLELGVEHELKLYYSNTDRKDDPGYHDLYTTTKFAKALKVTYDGNGNTGGYAPSDSKYYYPPDNNIAKVKTVSSSFKKAAETHYNYIFNEWNTSRDGSGSGYQPNENLTLGDDNITLYAQWLNYDFEDSSKNQKYYKTSTGGLTFVCSGPNNNGTVTLPDNGVEISQIPDFDSSKFTKTGTTNTTITLTKAYLDTLEDGVYTLKLTYSNTLYAITNFTVGTKHMLEYDSNGATSGTVPEDPTAYDPNQTVTVSDNTKNLKKTNYKFNGWNTKPDGSGDSYPVGTEFQIAENMTLYVDWLTYYFTNGPQIFIKNVTTDGLTFNCTGPCVRNSGTSDDYLYSVYVDGSSLSSSKYTKSGGTIETIINIPNTYLSGLSNGTHTLELRYDSSIRVSTTFEVTDKYMITYNSNNSTSGSPPVDNSLYDLNDEVTIKGKNTLVKDPETDHNYIFDGWNTQADGNGTPYKENEKLNISGNMTLYAQWLSYKFTSGANLTYNNRTTNNLTFVCSGPYNGGDNTKVTLSSVKVDGTEIDITDNYTVNGTTDTTIELLDSYLNSLGTGNNTHTLKLEYNNSLYVSINFNTNITNYKITYNANGATEGTAPTDNNEYRYNTSVTVKDSSTAGFKKKDSNGYTIGLYNGWNTRADGKGTTYRELYEPEGTDAATSVDSFNILNNTTVFVNWLSFKFIDNERVFYKNDPKNLVFKVNADYSLFTGGTVEIDSTQIASTTEYTATSGSTVITLLTDYLETKDVGTYTIAITFKVGGEDLSAVTTFKVAENRPVNNGGGSSGSGYIVPNTRVE